MMASNDLANFEHGKKARLVMLPAEPHGLRSGQSLGHTLWEMTQWLDKYVKRPRH